MSGTAHVKMPLDPATVTLPGMQAEITYSSMSGAGQVAMTVLVPVTLLLPGSHTEVTYLPSEGTSHTSKVVCCWNDDEEQVVVHTPVTSWLSPGS